MTTTDFANDQPSPDTHKSCVVGEPAPPGDQCTLGAHVNHVAGGPHFTDHNVYDVWCDDPIWHHPPMWHQTREHPVPCNRCRTPTWHVHGACLSCIEDLHADTNSWEAS